MLILAYIVIGMLIAGYIYSQVKNQTEDDETTVAYKLVAITLCWPPILVLFLVLIFGHTLKKIVDKITE